MPGDARGVRQARLLSELDLLRALCSARDEKDRRAEIVRTLEAYSFIEPEHQVLFESIRAVFTKPGFSSALLARHLNNRGFPDVDLEKYFANEPPNLDEAIILARSLSSGGLT